MGKPLKYILLLAVALSTFSCKRYVCPAYYTSFNITKGAPEEFFNYFVADTAKSVVQLKPKANDHRLLSFKKGEEPMNDRMFKSRGRDINGLTAKQKQPVLDRIFTRRQGNTMRHVRAKITFPELDSLALEELYAVDDSLFNADRFKRDQLFYMHLYGFAIMDSMNAAKDRRHAELDSLNALQGPEEERDFSKEKRAMEKKLRKSGELGKDEELSDAEFQQRWQQEVASDPKLQKKEQKRQQKEAKRKEKAKNKPPKPAKLKKEKPQLAPNKKDKKRKEKENQPDEESTPPADDGN